MSKKRSPRAARLLGGEIEEERITVTREIMTGDQIIGLGFGDAPVENFTRCYFAHDDFQSKNKWEDWFQLLVAFLVATTIMYFILQLLESLSGWLAFVIASFFSMMLGFSIHFFRNRIRKVRPTDRYEVICTRDKKGNRGKCQALRLPPRKN